MIVIKLWTTHTAIELCIKLEMIAPKHGLHVALTGGCLYKTGARKDVDIILYRIRQVECPNVENFYLEINDVLGITVGNQFGWVTKAKTIDGLDIDFFDAEYDDSNSTYGEHEVWTGQNEPLPWPTIPAIPVLKAP